MSRFEILEKFHPNSKRAHVGHTSERHVVLRLSVPREGRWFTTEQSPLPYE